MGGVPEVFVTAHDALVTRAGLQPGEWVLVHAVGSRRRHRRRCSSPRRSAHGHRHRAHADKLDRCRRARPRRTRSSRRARRRRARRRRARVRRSSRRPTAASTSTIDLVGGRYVEVDIAAAALAGPHRARRRDRREPRRRSPVHIDDGQAARDLRHRAARARTSKRRRPRPRRSCATSCRCSPTARSRRSSTRSSRSIGRAEAYELRGVGHDVRQGHPRLPLNVAEQRADQRDLDRDGACRRVPVDVTANGRCCVEADHPVEHAFEVAGLRRPRARCACPVGVIRFGPGVGRPRRSRSRSRTPARSGPTRNAPPATVTGAPEPSWVNGPGCVLDACSSARRRPST